jgi:hypothetical protein
MFPGYRQHCRESSPPLAYPLYQHSLPPPPPPPHLVRGPTQLPANEETHRELSGERSVRQSVCDSLVRLFSYIGASDSPSDVSQVESSDSPSDVSQVESSDSPSAVSQVESSDSLSDVSQVESSESLSGCSHISESVTLRWTNF